MDRKPTSKASPKHPVSGRVSQEIKSALDSIAKEEHRTSSQVLEMLLAESPRLKARLNGKGKRRAK